MAKEGSLGAKIGSGIQHLKGNWSKPSEGRYLSIKEMGAYSVGGMGTNFIINIVYMFVSASYIPVMYGIDIAHGTTIPIVCSILSLIIQPFYGRMLDNTHTKWGKFKPYLIFLTPLVVVFTILACWVPMDSTEQVKVVYAYLTCVPTTLLSGIWMGIYNTYPVAMTPNAIERTDMLSVVGIVSSMAPTVMNILVGPVRQYFINRGAEYLAFRWLGCIFCILGGIMTYLIVFFTKERLYITKEARPKIPFLYGVKQVMKNKPYWAWTLANSVFGTLRLTIGGSMMFIGMYKFASEYGQGESIRSALSLVVGFGATPAMALMPIFARKFGKKRTMLFAHGVCTVAMAAILLVGVQNIPVGMPSIVVFTVLGFLLSFNSGITMVVSPAIGTEINDYQQYKTGERLEGFMGAVGAWVAVIGSLVSYVPTMIQKGIGFDYGSDAFKSNLVYQPDLTAICNKWFNIALVISIVASVIWMLILGIFYRLNEKEHARVMDEIRGRSTNRSEIDHDQPEMAKAGLSGQSGAGLSDDATEQSWAQKEQATEKDEFHL